MKIKLTKKLKKFILKDFNERVFFEIMKKNNK